MRVPYRLGTDLFCTFVGRGFVHMGDMVEVASSFPDGELSSVGKLESATYGEDGFIKGVEVREADGLPTYMPNRGVFYRVSGGEEMASWCDGVPNPVDSNGCVVPLDTEELVYRGKTRKVCGFSYSIVHGCWGASFVDGNDVNVKFCTLPDSWERLEEDAAKTSCGYFGRSGLCVGCPALAISKMCNVAKSQDIVRRAKELAGVSVND